MTRKELITVVKEMILEAVADGSMTKRCATAIINAYDAILALPIDVPRDEEIKDESLNGQINFYDSKFLSWLNDEEQHIFITSAKWMRDEILKRNRP